MTIKRYGFFSCIDGVVPCKSPCFIDEHKEGEFIRVSELRELLKKKDKEAQGDFDENSVDCEDWKEQLKKGDDRLDHAEMMEDACMEKDKALGKQELIGELLAELQGPLCERAPAEKTASDSRQDKSKLVKDESLGVKPPACPKKRRRYATKKFVKDLFNEEEKVTK